MTGYHAGYSVQYRLGGMPPAHRAYMHHYMMTAPVIVQPVVFYPVAAQPPQPTQVTVYDIEDGSSAMYAPIPLPPPEERSPSVSADFSAASRRDKREDRAAARHDRREERADDRRERREEKRRQRREERLARRRARKEGREHPAETEDAPPSPKKAFNASAAKPAAEKPEWPQVDERWNATIYTWENGVTRTTYNNGTIIERDAKGDVTALGIPGGTPQPVTKTTDKRMNIYTGPDGFAVTDYPGGVSSVGKDLSPSGTPRTLENKHTVTAYGGRVEIETDEEGEVVGMIRLSDKKKLRVDKDDKTLFASDAVQYTCLEEDINIIRHHDGRLEVRHILGVLSRSPMHGAPPSPTIAPSKRTEGPPPLEEKVAVDDTWVRNPATQRWTNDPEVREAVRHAAAEASAPAVVPASEQSLAGEMPRPSKPSLEEALATLDRDLADLLARLHLSPPAAAPTPAGPTRGPAPSLPA